VSGWSDPRRLGSLQVVDVTDATFQEAVLERSRELPVVVDFWADWCGPCKALAPVLEREVAERAGRLELAKLDVDANPSTAASYGVQSIPAVKAFRDGRIVDEFVGALPPQSVGEFLDRLLGPSEGERLLDELGTSGEFPEILGPLAEGDYERALEWLLARATDADAQGRERVREVMVAIFQELGQDDPVAVSYRRRLATTLY
jgi:thioredoxin